MGSHSKLLANIVPVRLYEVDGVGTYLVHSRSSRSGRSGRSGFVVSNDSAAFPFRGLPTQPTVKSMKAGRGLGKALGCQSGGCTRRDKETALDIGHWKSKRLGGNAHPSMLCEVPRYHLHIVHVRTVAVQLLRCRERHPWSFNQSASTVPGCS